MSPGATRKTPKVSWRYTEGDMLSAPGHRNYAAKSKTHSRQA